VTGETKTTRSYLQDYLWVLPALLLVLFFVGYASLYAVRLSFQAYNLSTGENALVGFKNYGRFLRDGDYWSSMLATGKFFTASMILIVLGSLILALLLKRNLRLRATFRAIFMLPWILSMVVTGLVFTWLFDAQTGPVNFVLKSLHIVPVIWLGDPLAAFSLLVFAYVWKVTPFAMIIFLAGLQSIDEEYYEAAAVDGARPFTQFRYITLPFLKPQFLVVVVLMSLLTLNTVDMVFAITKGGPGTATRLVSYHMYLIAFANGKMGYGAAVAMSLFVLNIILTLLYSRFLRTEVRY
jgi:multiple sugar transport system permease protein